MFEEFIRELRRLERPVSVKISMPVDDKGYFDRRCPHRECQSDFKVLFVDWRDKVPNAHAWCPKCGKQAEPSTFNTSWQKKYIADVGRAHMARRLNDALGRAARRTPPKKISAGLFGITMSVKHSGGRIPFVLPAKAADELRQDLACEACGCRYATIGAGFFCPACGNNSPLKDFDQTIEMTRKIIGGIEALTAAFETAHDADSAANFEQQLLEDQLENLVTAFQRAIDALFARLPNAVTFKRDVNVFQRLGDGSELWKKAAGKGYEDLVDAGEIAHLQMMIHRRHKIGHCQGIVDAKYVQQSGDCGYEVGQKLVIAEQHVIRLADVVEKLVGCLKTIVRGQGGAI